MRRRSLVLSLPALLAFALTTLGQGAIRSLEVGVPVKKTLAATQTHSYTVSVEKNQFVQLTVGQFDIDVVVRVFLPDGTLLREFDSPTGTAGAEYIEFVADSPGNYRVDVGQLAGGEATGQYEIKIEEQRKATELELRNLKNERTRKAKGLALLTDTMPSVDQLRLPETRVDLRIKAGQLMWKSDEKRAAKLFALAAEDVRELIARMSSEEGDSETYQLAMQLRQQLIRALAPHDPEAALKFLQSTRIPAELVTDGGQSDPELPLEFQLVNQVVAADPKRAFDLAEDLLKRTSSASLVDTLTQLASKDRELAGRLAHDIAAKLMHQDLLKTREAAYLTVSLLNIVRTTQTVTTNNGEGPANARMLSDEDYRDLFRKLVDEVMVYSAPTPITNYTPEFEAVRVLASFIRQMPNEMKTYAADRSASVDKKLVELIGPSEQPVVADWQRYQTTINSAPLETALDSVTEAPVQMRDYLYQQVAARIATSGDLARARQVVSEKVANPAQRQAALFTLQQQEVNSAADKGRYDEALRLLSKFRAGPDRDAMVTQILDQLNPGVKRQVALQYLAQGKNIITSSPRAEDQGQMNSLLMLARVFARYDVNQAFEIVEPLLAQFNELSAAAVTMNGFDREYYREGELVTSNENPVAVLANQFSDTLATLAMFDFDRAKTTADGLNRLDVRIRAFLFIAQRTMEIPLEPEEPVGYNSNEQ